MLFGIKQVDNIPKEDDKTKDKIINRSLEQYMIPDIISIIINYFSDQSEYFEVGDIILDITMKCYIISKIKSINFTKSGQKTILIHHIGRQSKYDEWIDVPSNRLQSLSRFINNPIDKICDINIVGNNNFRMNEKIKIKWWGLHNNCLQCCFQILAGEKINSLFCAKINSISQWIKFILT